ncbi:MAG: lipid-A-disaccharide synthase [Inquilinaceae bacterium]
MTPALDIFIVAGEPSGDLLGARIMAALRRQAVSGIRFRGIGGPRMEAEGLVSLFPMTELSVMGVAELLPRLRGLLRRIRQTVAAAGTPKPDAVLTIDSPAFSFRVARRLHGHSFPLIHCVAPTVWAWRPGRARAIAGFLDHLLVLLPFEPPYFEAEGLPCTFIGHPIVESGAGTGDGSGFRAAHGIAPDVPVLCVLPGSRQGELSRLVPEFRRTVALLAASKPDLRVVVPTVAHLRDAIAAEIADWKAPALMVEGDRDKYDAFAASNAALAASGTVALELGLAGVPQVNAYKLHPLSANLARFLLRTRYANLINIIHDRAIIPEFLQACPPDRMAAAVAALLDDSEAAGRQRRAAHEAMLKLGLGGPSPSERAARVVLDTIEGGHGGAADRE